MFFPDSIKQVLIILIAGFRIDEKSVSRKHITIAVSPVKPGDVVSWSVLAFDIFLSGFPVICSHSICYQNYR